jgi:hypothetical protein
MKTLLLLAILCVPALVHADVWRWRDARGQLHYSNVSEHVPPHATVVTGGIGTLASEVPAPDMKAIERDLEAYDKLHAARAAREAAAPPAPVTYSYGWPGGVAVTQIVAPTLCQGEYPCAPSMLFSHNAPVNLWLWQARWTLAWRELGVVN